MVKKVDIVFLIFRCCFVVSYEAKEALKQDDMIEHHVVRRQIIDQTDPCLTSNHHNITHLGNRYVNLKGTCPYTDGRIANVWFYAGVDPIATHPHIPKMCSCGYKFPLWMNGTLPGVEDGIVPRTTCMVFGPFTCDQVVQIQIKNCSSFFVYHLSAPPDDAGFCFGLDKPIVLSSSSSTETPHTTTNTSTLTASSASMTTTHTSHVTVANSASQQSTTSSSSTSSTSEIKVPATIDTTMPSSASPRKSTYTMQTTHVEVQTPYTDITTQKTGTTMPSSASPRTSTYTTHLAVQTPYTDITTQTTGTTMPSASPRTSTFSTHVEAQTLYTDTTTKMTGTTMPSSASPRTSTYTTHLAGQTPYMDITTQKTGTTMPSSASPRTSTYTMQTTHVEVQTPYMDITTHITATARVIISQTSITKESFEATIEYISDVMNPSAEVILKDATGAVIKIYAISSVTSKLSFSGLSQGSKYILTVTVNHRKYLLDEKVVFTQPSVEAYLAYNSVNTAFAQTAFRCLCTASPEQLLYVRWFGDQFSIKKKGYANKDGNSLDLFESDLLAKRIHLPFNISCSFGEQNDSMSVQSEKLFAGIEVKTMSLTTLRNETKAIRISPTIPFGCYESVSDVHTCNLTIVISIPITRECMGISTRKCRISISKEVGKESEIQIQSTEDGQYGVTRDAVFDVILRTAKLENSIWNDYFLPTIKVTVLPERMTYWRGKRCEALNDPHMFTFDAMQYEHHESLADEYVLYTHKEFNVKIHHRLERCNSNAMCNCGIAVQAGKDIYIISTCNNILEIGYRQCDDSVLLVKQESDAMYTIYLPFGTYVKARLDKTPYADSVGSMIVSVSVYPSVHDLNGRSSGLCGTLDNNAANDFHGRNGEHLTDKTDFIHAWRVPKSESLFDPKARSSESWTLPACSCSVRNGEILEEDVCTLGADNTCSKGRKVGEQTCILAKKVLLSSGETTNGQNIPTFNLNNNGNHNTLPTSIVTVPSTLGTKRSTITGIPLSNNTPSVTPPKLWDYETAMKECQQYMDASRAFQLCTLIPYTDTQRSVDTCALDLVLSQTTRWQRLSRQSMQDSCVAEISRNKTVRQDIDATQKTSTTHRPIYSTTASHLSPISTAKGIVRTTTQSPKELTFSEIIETLQEITCPNGCSDQGQCKNGTCICSRGFGGDDCSIDFSKPPSAASLVYSNLCDEKLAPCSSVYIHGGFFASDSVSCHVTTYESQVGKEGRQNLDAYVVRGSTQSLIEVICPLLPTRRVRSVSDQGVKLISCYKVSVSNDGVHHGNPLEMCVYNSECQLLQNTSLGLLTATIKNGFCFIDGKCFQSGVNSYDKFCIPEIYRFGWSYTTSIVAGSTSTASMSSTPALQTPVTPMTSVDSAPSWQTPVIVAVTCMCVVCLVVTLVIYMRIRKNRMTENSTQEEELEVKYKHDDTDFDEEAYAHINPVDVSDHVNCNTSKSDESNDLVFIGLNDARFEKSTRRLLIQMDDVNHYTGLDKKTREKAQYDKLKDAVRQNEQAPELPDRSPGYEKLKDAGRRAPDYEQVKTQNSQSDHYTGLDKMTRDKVFYETLKEAKKQEHRSEDNPDGSDGYEKAAAVAYRP